jgi:hypothetical protein
MLLYHIRFLSFSLFLENNLTVAVEEMIAVRSNFDALAKFEPSLVTDAEGRSSVRFQLPDSITRYRIWAIACTGKSFLLIISYLGPIALTEFL